MRRIQRTALALVATAFVTALAVAPAAKAASQPDPLSSASLMSTIDQYGSSPNHYSGTQADWSEENTVAEQFEADGLKVNSIAYNFPRFQPTHISLSVDSTYFPASALAPLLYSGTTGPNGITAPLAAAANGEMPAGAAGKIVVVSALSKGAIATSVPKAIAAGAAAEVFVTNSLHNLPAWEDVNSRQGTGTLPVILIGKKSGAELLADAEAGKEATFTLQAELGTATDYDVWGELPGVDTSRKVIVGTPVSSMVPSASERGGGVAVLLALARHYAEEPRSQRSENLVFLATSGHEVGFLGLPALLQQEGSWFTSADAYVHLGASIGAYNGVENPDGSVTVTGGTAKSLTLHDSENPLLETSSVNAFAAAGQPLKNAAMHLGGSGEQVYAYQEGIPEISANSGSLWFHTAADLPSVVAPEILTGLTQGFLGSVDAILAQPAGAVIGANTEAKADAVGYVADNHSPGNAEFAAGGFGGTGLKPAGPGLWSYTPPAETGSGGSTNSGSTTTPPATTKVGAGSLAGKLSIKGKKLLIPLSCVGDGACSGKASVTSKPTGKKKAVTLASGRYSIAAGQKATVKLSLTKAGRKLVASSTVKTAGEKHGKPAKSLLGRFTLKDSGQPSRVTLELPVSL
jgi:PA domain